MEYDKSKLMAVRQLFMPRQDCIGVKIYNVNFGYFLGFSIQLKQKSIKSLHEACNSMGVSNVLEVSSNSENPLGVSLSAFNLSTTSLKLKRRFTVEQAFQSSKVFEHGGPYIDLLDKTSREAKKDSRLRTSGNILYFKFFEKKYEKTPPTLFYDWLYINVLLKNELLIKKFVEYDAFTDIEFNSKKSINCQAYTLALFKSLECNKIDFQELKDITILKKYCEAEYNHRWQEAQYLMSIS